MGIKPRKPDHKRKIQFAKIKNYQCDRPEKKLINLNPRQEFTQLFFSDKNQSK
jgi:hypothetical protein